MTPQSKSGHVPLSDVSFDSQLARSQNISTLSPLPNAPAARICAPCFGERGSSGRRSSISISTISCCKFPGASPSRSTNIYGAFSKSAARRTASSAPRFIGPIFNFCFCRICRAGSRIRAGYSLTAVAQAVSYTKAAQTQQWRSSAIAQATPKFDFNTILQWHRQLVADKNAWARPWSSSLLTIGNS